MESKPVVNAKVGIEKSTQVPLHALMQPSLNEERRENEECPYEDNLLLVDEDFSKSKNDKILRKRLFPSFSKARRSSTSSEMIKPNVEAPISSLSVPGQSVVIVRPRASSAQADPKGHSSLVLEEGDEEIVEEEAVCKFCFDVFKEENTVKTVCRCKNALIHEECAANWLREKSNNDCDFCGEKVKNFPVTLLRGLSSTQGLMQKRVTNKAYFHA